MASAGSATRPPAADMRWRWPCAGWLAERVIRAGRTTAGWICAAFGLPEGPGAAIISVSRGAMGQIWRLDLGANRFAVKELCWEASEEPARREAELTAYLEAAGIRLPARVPSLSGCFVARLPAGSGGEWLRRYRWTDGVPVDLADAGVAARAGGLPGRLHACALPPRGEAGPWYGHLSRTRRPGTSWLTPRSRTGRHGPRLWPGAPACCASSPLWSRPGRATR